MTAEPNGRAGEPPDEDSKALRTRLPSEDLTKDPFLAFLERDDQNRPVIGGIPLLRRLGHGGMGRVYYGFHPRLQVEVAVKVLPFHLPEEDPHALERFHSEARISASLTSENIVHILDVNSEGDTHYIVMEYVHGRSASDMLQEARKAGRAGLPESEVLLIVAAACRGLAEAHMEGIIHRDIKPDNIMIPKGVLRKAKLTDLGIAKALDQSELPPTSTGQILGTAGFIAPELATKPKRVIPQGDVYSIGATIFCLLTGHPPFQGPDGMTVLFDTVHKPAPVLPGPFSGEMRAIVARCLEKNPADRFESGVELSEILEDLLSERRMRKKTEPPIPPRPAPKSQNTERRLGLLATAVLIVAIVALVLAIPWVPSEGPRGAKGVSAIGLHARGLRKLDKGDRVGALADFDRAIEVDPLLAAAWFDRGRTHRDLGSTEKALRDFRRFLELAEDSPRADEIRIWLSRFEERAHFEIVLNEDKGIRMSFVRLLAGSFLMGDALGDPSEKPHKVTLTRDFWMQTTEVTQAQWTEIMGSNPSRFKGEEHPVDTVTWTEAREFVNKLGERLGEKDVSLPTEAEWEYACRARTRSRWSFGSDESLLSDYAWFAGNSGLTTHPVARKRPNAWGLYDVHGNVLEWCQDWLGPYEGDIVDPAGPPSGSVRVLRSGGYDHTSGKLTSSFRNWGMPDVRHSSVGLRIVLRDRE